GLLHRPPGVLFDLRRRGLRRQAQPPGRLRQRLHVPVGDRAPGRHAPRPGGARPRRLGEDLARASEALAGNSLLQTARLSDLVPPAAPATDVRGFPRIGLDSGTGTALVPKATGLARAGILGGGPVGWRRWPIQAPGMAAKARSTWPPRAAAASWR